MFIALETQGIEAGLRIVLALLFGRRSRFYRRCLFGGLHSLLQLRGMQLRARV